MRRAARGLSFIHSTSRPAYRARHGEAVVRLPPLSAPRLAWGRVMIVKRGLELFSEPPPHLAGQMQKGLGV